MIRIYSKKVDYDGIRFDSDMECDFYKLLKEREARHEVDDIEVHKPYELQPAFELDGVCHKPIIYEVDFEYFDYTDQRWHYVDVKGMLTEHFELKYKMFEYQEHKHLEILKYSKTTGWVEYKDYKRIMREKKRKVVAEKNIYKQLYELNKELKELKAISNPNGVIKNKIKNREKKLEELNAKV